MSLRIIKKSIRYLQEWLERSVIGTSLQEWLWRSRHLYRRGWARGYLNTVDHPHRLQIVEAVSAFLPLRSVLEVGCASGANLVCLRERMPGVSFTGVDINRKAIFVAKKYFAERGDRQVSCFAGQAHRLTEIADISMDIVLTDAVLMFIAPDRIRNVLAEFGRVCRKGLVFNEYHCEGEVAGRFDGGRWVYDLAVLLGEQFPNAEIKMEKSAFVGGAWDSYGRLIVVRL